MTRLLPERTVYIRANRRTTHVVMGPASQMAAGVALAALVSWTAFTTVSFIDAALEHEPRAPVATWQEAYEARIAALEAHRRHLEGKLAEADLRREGASSRLSENRHELADTVQELRESEETTAATRAAAAALRDEARRNRDEVERLSAEVVALRLALAESESARDGLARSIETVGEAIDGVIVERDFAMARNASLSRLVTDLERQVSEAVGRQDEILTQLETVTEAGLTGLDRMFRAAEIDIDTILAELAEGYSGTGGPDEPIELASLGAHEDARLAALMSDLEQVNLMRFAADRLPFSRPVTGGRFTSGFGPRRDPFSGRSSMHRGIDFAAPRGTPIYATAEGIVTFVGRQRGYGNIVEIRHAFGFETVYAHLDRAHVTVGQQVRRGDRIADMGSTGRSSGYHLHYEVRIDNEAINPMKLIEAARDVL